MLKGETTQFRTLITTNLYLGVVFLAWGIILMLLNFPAYQTLGYLLVMLYPVLVCTFIVGFAVAVINIVAAFLSFKKYSIDIKRKYVLAVLAILSLGYVTTAIFVGYKVYTSNLAHDRTFTRDEAVVLIKTCKVAELYARSDSTTYVVGFRENLAPEFSSNISHVATARLDDLRGVAQEAKGCPPIKLGD